MQSSHLQTFVDQLSAVELVFVEPSFLRAGGLGAPHATTLTRVFGRLDSDAFDLLAVDWAQCLRRPVAIAVDGKEMRGAKNGKGSRVHPLSAFDKDTHAVLAQMAVGEKSNEIPQLPVLMDHFGPCQMWWSQPTFCIHRPATPVTWRGAERSTSSP